MSIASTDLLLCGAANMVAADTGTVGGAIDTTCRLAFTQFSAAAKLSLTSDGADTRNATPTGRLASGSVVNETKVLNGVTEVLSTNTFERIQGVVLAATDGARTVTLKQGSGGSTIGTLPPGVSSLLMMFRNALAPSSGSTTRYEKAFWKNNHGSLSLLGATLTLTADPAAQIMIGVATSADDSGTATNRLTAPSGVTFVDDNVAIAVPGTDLASGSAIGFWASQTLTSSASAGKSSYTTQLAGGST